MGVSDASRPVERAAFALLGVAVSALALWSAPLLLQAYGGLARAILGPREDPALAQRVRHLAQTRAETLDASAAEIRSALDLLEARAQFDGPQRAVHVRVAEHAGHIYLDLADERWRAVDIGPDGWRVIGCPPVRFRRPAGMLPLPVPQQGGSIEALASFLNLASRDDFILVVAWLSAALRPGGPYPLLALSGEQGSAKTVLSKVLKALIDPNAAPVRSRGRAGERAAAERIPRRGPAHISLTAL